MRVQMILLWLCLVAIDTIGGQSLAGRALEITTINSPPLVIVNNATVARTRGTYEGILIDVLQRVASMANFTYSIHVVFDNRYGFESSPGVWNGMIGEIMNNDADIAVAPLTVTSARAKQVTYTQPIMDAGLRILYRKSPPDVSNQSLLILLAPFTTGLWFMVVACFVFASLVFFVIGKLSPYEEPQIKTDTSDVSYISTLVNVAVYSISSFLHQDIRSMPRSPSGRVMSVFWWIFTTMVVTTFAANFTAFISSKSPDIRKIPFLNFNELSQQTDVKYGATLNGSTVQYFKNSKRPMQQRIWKQMSSDPTANSKSFEDGVRRVRTENYAFISEGPHAKYHMNRAPCDIMVVGPPIEDRLYGFVCGKNSDVCNLLNPHIITLSRTGFLKSTIKKWVNPGVCSSFLTRVVRMRGSPIVDAFGKLGIRMETQMSFTRVSAAFFIMLGGILLTLVTLGGEILYVSKFGPPK